VQSANKLEAGAIEFSGVKTVNAEEGVDRVTGAGKADWLLGGNGTAINSGIRFSGAEEFTATNADLIGTEGQDVFALTEEGDVKVDSLRFKGLNSVDGNAGDDSVDASEFAGGLALTGNTKEVLAGLLKFSNIESAVTSILTGSANRDIFILSGGEGAFSSAGVNFSGVTQVSGGGGTDQIQGSAKTESFELSRNGDIEVARIMFEGVSEVAAGGGVDTVNADGALWTSTKGNDGLIDNSAEATVNGITVLFTELEKVMGTGVYSGQDIPSEYVFNDLDTMSIGGITFSGLTELIAGSARDVLYGSDIDAFWRLDALEGKITSGDSSIIFNGIESIIAGSGADNFELLGGDYASVDTGAGNDEVILAGTRVGSLSLGEGDDRLQVDADSAQSVKLSGGGGKDRFELNLEGKTWEIFAGLGGLNRVGNFQFSNFESLDNNVGNLRLNTNQKLAFVNGGDGPGARFGNGDMFLGFDGTKDVAVTSSGNETITGDLVARRAELNVAGNVDIGTEVGTLSILTTSGDIDVTVHAERDLEIGKIDAGRGTVQLTSGAFGNLTAEQAGGTHIKAGRATFGTASGPWGQIGTSINPLGLDVTESVAFYAGSIFDPKYIGQEPGVVTSVGDELQSTSSAQTAQGIKSAVQNATEDFTQVDPAIFEEVRPYSAGVNALYVPEMKLVDGVLVPVYSEENSESDQAGHRETSTFPLESADASAVRYGLQSELQL
ncbi:MAG: hypothetical protein K0U59_09140, partial [Gammaproteobacteria bacterium]|nr:hypothetical protein [Gammaproteobacteria bacterium]